MGEVTGQRTPTKGISDSTEYRISYVADEALPDEIPWVFICCDGTLTLALKASEVCPRVLADAWAAFRDITSERGVRRKVSLCSEDGVRFARRYLQLVRADGSVPLQGRRPPL